MATTATEDLLTIILTLKGRYNYTKRWLDWMNQQRCPFRIIIADGSLDNTIEKHLEDHCYEFLKLTYKRFPYDATLKHWFEKIAKASAIVETELAVHADNDDFFLKQSLTEAVNNFPREEYVCVSRSQYRLRINEKGESIDDHLATGGGKILVTKTPCSDALQALANEACQVRLEYKVKNFQPSLIWYGLHRTSNLARIHTNVLKMGITQAMFQEWYIIYSTAIAGKIQIVDSTPYLVRQEQTSTGAGTLYDKERLDRIFLYPGWSENLAQLKRQLYSEIHNEGWNIDEEEFQEKFIEWFSIHLLKFNDGRLIRMRVSNHPRLIAVGSRVLNWMKGNGPLLNKYSRIEKYRDNQDLVDLNRFLKNYKPQ